MDKKIFQQQNHKLIHPAMESLLETFQKRMFVLTFFLELSQNSLIEPVGNGKFLCPFKDSLGQILK